MNSLRFGIGTASVMVALVAPAFAQNSTVISLGLDDGGQGDFEQENGQLADYYWDDGDYTALGGLFWTGGREPLMTEANTANEDGLGFPRALTTGFTQIRIFFQLDALHSDPVATYTFETDMILPRTATVDGTTLASEHDLEFSLNGVVIATAEGISTGPVSATFSPAEVGAVEGSNVLTLRRTGGNNPWPTDGSPGTPGNPTAAWIQFDFVRLVADLSGVTCPEPICDFRVFPTEITPGGTVDLTWLASPSATTLEIDEGVGDVLPMTTDGFGTINLAPTKNTTYTLLSDGPAGMASEAVDVTVTNIASFTASEVFFFADEATTVDLAWTVDPSATVSIDNGIGNVDAFTSNGAGLYAVQPTETTTYTLTSDRAGDIEEAQVTVTVSPHILVWALGDDNGNQSEFEQENAQLVDYYYNDGDYTGIGGVFWTGGMEPWRSDEPDNEPEDGLGFPRALTSWVTEFDIFFTVPPGSHSTTGGFSVFGELIFPRVVNDLPTTHDLAFYLNRNPTPFYTLAGVSSTPFAVSVPGGVGNLQEGANVLTIQRTGGDPDSWIQFDYINLAAGPPGAGGPEILAIRIDEITGDVELDFTSDPGAFYTIWRSEELSFFYDLNDSYPSGGASETVTTFIDAGAAALFDMVYYQVSRN